MGVDKAFYEKNGYAVVKGVFTRDETDQMRLEIDALVSRMDASGEGDATWGGEWRDTMQTPEVSDHARIVSIHNLQLQSATFTKILLDDRFTSLLADVIGPNVQLHHTKMHIKAPETGSPFPLHQDYPYFPHENHTMTAAVINVDDAKTENGCLCVVPGSHKLGPLEHICEGSNYLDPEKYPLEDATPVEAEAGDVLLFNYLTIHGSRLNTSGVARRILLCQFRAPSDKPLEAAHTSPCQGMIVRGINA